jgi:hypothetical protein
MDLHRVLGIYEEGKRLTGTSWNLKKSYCAKSWDGHPKNNRVCYAVPVWIVKIAKVL